MAKGRGAYHANNTGRTLPGDKQVNVDKDVKEKKKAEKKQEEEVHKGATGRKKNSKFAHKKATKKKMLISVNENIYDAVDEYCTMNGIQKSTFVEQLLREKLKDEELETDF